MKSENRQALDVLEEAARIAALGPYPDRQIECDLVIAIIADDMGDTTRTTRHARSAITIALKTGHTGELAQAYTFLGLALSEESSFEGSSEAFEQGLLALNEQTESYRAMLACGLADSLFHLGQKHRAISVLAENADAIEREPRRAFHSAAIRWHAGTATEEAVLESAATMAEVDMKVEAQTALAILRLNVPGHVASTYLRHARENVENAGQLVRLARLQRQAKD